MPATDTATARIEGDLNEAAQKKPERCFSNAVLTEMQWAAVCKTGF